MNTSNYKATPVSRDNIRWLTKLIREKTGYKDTLYFPVIEFVEFILPQTMSDFVLEIRPFIEMVETCGETKPSEQRIILNESIYNKAVDGDGFARMTVAHELGHLFLHNNESIALCRLNKGQKLKPYEDPEWQADAFGGELLAPYYLIGNMTVDEIAEKCGVTQRAASVQKSKLK